MIKLIAIIFVVASYNLVFFHQGWPIVGTYGFAALIVSLNIFTWLTHPPQPKSKHNQHGYKTLWLIEAVIAGATIMALIRASWLDRTILSLTALGLSGLLYYLLSKPEPQILALSEIVLYPLRLLTGLFPAIDASFRYVSLLWNRSQTLRTHPEKPINVGAVIRGFFLSGIIIFFISTLLMAGDAAFDSFVRELVDIQIEATWLQRLVFSVGLTIVSLPLSFIAIRQPFRSPLATTEYAKHRTELYIVVGSVLAVMATFLVVQAPYLFISVPEDQFSQFGISTYSEYVRRGFVELSLVSAIIYGVTGLAYVVIRARVLIIDWLKWLTISLLSIDLIFILSIFRRLFLYANSHGLTLARVYGAIFLLAVIGMTLTLIGRLTFPKRFIWHYIEGGILLGALFLPGLINPEQLIWRYAPPTVNHEVDYTYLANQGPDGIEGWLVAYQDTQEWLNQYRDGLRPEIISPEEFRALRYHVVTYAALIRDYAELEYRYGDPETLESFCSLIQTTQFFLPPCYRDQPMTNTIFHTNVGETAALTRMRAYIDPAQLSADYYYLYQLMNQVTEQSHTPPEPLDRNINAPLLGD